MPGSNLQNMSSPLLTIAIPTYNRSKDLDAQINWAVNSIGDKWHNVELLVSDNASTDETAEICNRWKDKLGDKINIFRNQENVGLINNCFLSIERSVGDFVWLVGDDDPMGINALERVLGIIHKYGSIGLIHINHRCVSSTDGSIIIPKLYNYEDDIYATDDSVYYLSQILESSNTGGFMFITASVMNRKLALKFIKNNPPEEDLALVYPLLLNIGLAAQNGFYFVADCLVDCSYGASSWLDKMEQVQYEIIPRTLIKLKKLGISNNAIKVCMDFQFKPLKPLSHVLSLVRNNPKYIFDKGFANWVRRRILKSVLNQKIS